MAFDIKNIPIELIENFKSGNGVFFVGAGLSMGSGFPSWPKLIDELISLAEKQMHCDQTKIAEYRILKDDVTKFLLIVEDLKSELGINKYNDFMTERFVNHNNQPTINHDYIVSTNTNLIITINYDDLIDKAYMKKYADIPNKFTYSQSKEAANNFWKGRFFIMKAHGDAKQDIESLILTQKDYRKTLYRESGYRSLLQSIFTTKSILFVGVSMNDPEFNQLLDYLHDSYHGGGPSHYLLIDRRENLKSLSRRYFEDFKIETIGYDNSSGNYEEVTEFLEHLKNTAPRV